MKRSTQLIRSTKFIHSQQQLESSLNSIQFSQTITQKDIKSIS